MSDMIRVLAVGDPAVKGYIEEKEEIISKFNGNVAFDIVPWNEYYDKLMDVLQGKTSYDIVMVAGHLWKQDFVDLNYLEPLEFENEDILPVIAEEMYSDKIPYLSPSFCDGHMIVYRKKEVKEILGKELAEVLTPQEYIEIAKCMNESERQIVMKADKSEIFTDAIPFMRMFGGAIYHPITHEIQCDKQEVVDGLEQYCMLKEAAIDGTENCGNEEVVEALKTKKAIMGITWSGQLGVVSNEIDCEELGFSTLSTAWNVTWSFAISSKSKHVEQSQKLLEYLRSTQVDEIVGRYSGAPVRASSYEKGKDLYPWYSCQLKMINNAKPLPDLLNAGEKNGILYQEIAEAFVGNKTASEAMKDAQAKIALI